MGAIASQITSLTIVYSTVYSDADQRKHQRSASLAFVWGIHRGPLNSPHKWPVTRKMFPFDDVIMLHKDVTRASRPSFWSLNNSFIRLRTKKNLHIDGLCEGNPPATGGSPHEGQLMPKTFPCGDVNMIEIFLCECIYRTHIIVTSCP